MATKLVKKKFLLPVGILIIVCLIAGGVYAFLQYQKAQALLKNPTLAAQAEASSLVEKVGKLIALPSGEQPTIATVSDVKKLQGQAFFNGAKNGYKVLIYPKAKQAILYDPTTNKIVKVSSLNLNQPTPATATTPTLTKVALYNGTTTVGLTSSTEAKLKTQFANVKVVAKDNAAKATYDKTLVIDLTGKNAASASQLASYLTGEVGKLPSDETKPEDAEILVILGR